MEFFEGLTVGILIGAVVCFGMGVWLRIQRPWGESLEEDPGVIIPSSSQETLSEPVAAEGATAPIKQTVVPAH